MAMVMILDSSSAEFCGVSERLLVTVERSRIIQGHRIRRMEEILQR